MKVFTNGCFDILHAGHVRYLQNAAEFGTHLTVGINDDASFRRHKGREPIFNQESRVTIVSAIGCVDDVILFEEDTPYELIRELRPDVLVKGGDYRPDDVVGKEFVKKVICVSVGIDIHTTDVIEAIKKL